MPKVSIAVQAYGNLGGSAEFHEDYITTDPREERRAKYAVWNRVAAHATAESTKYMDEETPTPPHEREPQPTPDGGTYTEGKPEQTSLPSDTKPEETP